MSRARDQSERRRQILEAATRSALRRGLFEIRIKDVATDLGITEGAILYYYDTLAELRLQVYSRATRIWFDHRGLAGIGVGSATEQLAIHAAAGFATDIPEARLINEPVAGVSIIPAFRAVAESLFHNEVSRYQIILERGATSGEFEIQDDIVDAARNLYSLEESYRMHMFANTSITAETGLHLVLSYARLVTGASIGVSALR